ncbi:unnamed protein product [Rhizoctonia solani]|uniref:Phosphatidate phosphatase APP1 catalytic domain-containing protein n=1 Tax=Rhizoctonia solani TaxID=456999 RepID=A0A8H2XQV8_9AGAM|nr:unnamed protein product [Rhizoctonia solani]
MTSIPQRLLDLFDKATNKTDPPKPAEQAPTTDHDTSHVLPASTRLVAFDNTAFCPPSSSTSTCSTFPSGVCPSTQPNTHSIPPRSSESHTHIAEFVVAYMTSRSGDAGFFDDIVANIVSTLGLVRRGGPEEENVRSRVAMFLGLMKLGERAVLVSQDEAKQTVVAGPSSGNGISADLRWVQGRGRREVVWRALTAPDDPRAFEMRTFIPADSGWVVISDVDDTIKVSQVNNRIALLRNTFASDPSVVPGMPELYHILDARLNNAAWFYLSASPWQLYPFLHTFLNNAGQYPPGQLILRDMSRGAMPIYLSALTMGTQAYKVDRLSKVHEWLPEPARRVVLIGDSTQKDPESYGEIARKWPNWVGAIWIRVVQGVDERKERELNDPKRFEKAFDKVDKRIWRTFTDSKELHAAVAGLQ